MHGLSITQTTPWLTSLGYSLCFGTMLAKMVRVYYIFNNPTPRKAANVRDSIAICAQVPELASSI